MERITFLVNGRVQGVGFRYFTRRVATALGLFGWVRNLAGGQVEGEAEGPSVSLDQFLKELHKGPPQSSVSSVEIRSRSAIATAAYESFEIR